MQIRINNLFVCLIVTTGIYNDMIMLTKINFAADDAADDKGKSLVDFLNIF